MKVLLFIVMMISYSSFSQVADYELKKINIFLSVGGGRMTNNDVENYVSSDVAKSDWEMGRLISDFTNSFALGVDLRIKPKFRISISEEYFISATVSHSKVKLSTGGYQGNNINYYYRRFSTRAGILYESAIYHKLSAIAGAGISHNSIVFRKQEVSSSVFASGLYSNTIASTWTWGGHFRVGLGLRCTDWLALELCMYKDVLVPKKVNGLTLDYNIWGGDCTVGFSF